MATTPSDPLLSPAGEEKPPTPGQPPLLQDETRTLNRRRLVMRRFLRRKSAIFGLGTIVFLFLLAYLGPYLSEWKHTDVDPTAYLEGPSSDHWFGTTQIGKDMYELTLRGLQKSLLIGVIAAVLSTSMAALVGSCAGYFGGWVERVLIWFVDLLLVLPAFLILAILSPVFQNSGWIYLALLLALFQWLITARVIRGLSLSLREREFIQAARYMGVPARKIILRHMLPNMSSILIIDGTLNVGLVILAETGLSFFGLGVQPPDSSLGTLIGDGSRAALTFPWLFLFPGVLLILAVLAVNFLGDALRDALDPNSERARARTGAQAKGTV